MPRIKTFRQSIVIGFLAATYLPLIVFGYFSYSYINYKISESGQRSNLLLARNVAEEISSYLREPHIILQQYSRILKSYSGKGRQINELLSNAVIDSHLLNGIYILSKKKIVIHAGFDEDPEKSIRNQVGLDFSGLRAFRNMEFLQGPYWSESFLSPVSGEKCTAIILPVDENLYMVGLIDIAELHSILIRRKLENGSFMVVLDDMGEPLFFPEMNIVEEQRNYRHIEPFQEALVGNFGTFSFAMENEKYLGSSANIAETKWLVMVVQPSDIAEKPIRNIQVIMLFAMLAAAVVVLTVSLHQLRKLMSPLKNLQENIQAVARGKYNDEKEENGKILHEEFQKIAEHFSEMSKAIERREQMLELNEERLIALLELHNQKHLSEDALLEFSLEQAVSLTRSELGYMHILNPNEEEISKTVWSQAEIDLVTDHGASFSDILQDGLHEKCLDQRSLFIRNNKEETGEIINGEAAVASMKQLAVPIFDNKIIVAVVGMLNKKTDYDVTDARQLSLYFNHTWDILQQKVSEKVRERLAEQLAQAQKLEAIGTLAGGIAHDFNNVLMVILGNTEIAKDNVDDPKRIQQDLDEIFKASLRARDLVNQILAFSKDQAEGLKPLDIKPIIEEGIKLLRSSIPTTIQIEKEIDAQSFPVLSEPGQISQLLMNLCTNAYQAMEGSVGRLFISLKPVTLETDLFDRGKMVAEAGQYMQLIVKDSGKGITENDLQRIFEPYYTTREKERGTGLGLAVVHGIIKGLKGAIVVESVVGQGTEFILYLPVVKKTGSDEGQVLTASLPGGDEHILIVDDDQAVAAVNSKILEKLGYKVTTFTSSTEALTFFAERAEDLDLVITDMAMPEMTGDVLAQKILEINDTVPIILCTGYSEAIDENKAIEIGISELALKPLTKIDLALTVRKILGFTATNT